MVNMSRSALALAVGLMVSGVAARPHQHQHGERGHGGHGRHGHPGVAVPPPPPGFSVLPATEETETFVSFTGTETLTSFLTVSTTINAPGANTPNVAPPPPAANTPNVVPAPAPANTPNVVPPPPASSKFSSFFTSTSTLETSTSTTTSSAATSTSNSKYPPLDYSLVKCYASDFFDQFDFFTGADPTNGFVDYVDQSTAQSAGLISESSGSYIIASDSTNVAPGGRQSVRITSKDTYNQVLIIADFSHLPSAACGTWPAFWTTNLNNWPAGGEIDIIEGVNQDTTNHVALHTAPDCTVSPGAMTGSMATTDCDATVDGNAGCGGYANSFATYGDGFNQLGGGVYAMDWRAEGIRVWSFSRANIPSDILSGNPTTANWPMPDFDFTGPDANIPERFNDHQIIFDLTFCGDWAGNTFNQCGCSGTCTDYVANNPSAFADSYFAVQNLTVFKANNA